MILLTKSFGREARLVKGSPKLVRNSSLAQGCTRCHQPPTQAARQSALKVSNNEASDVL